MSNPVFPGIDDLLTLVRNLVRRPRLFERDPDLDVRGDLPLPLVCLVREPGADGFLARLDRALDAKLPKVPHVLVDVDRVGEHPDAVLPLLHELHVALRHQQLGRNPLRRFDHYELAHHLTGVRLPPRQVKREEPVETVLRAWSGGSPLSGPAAEVVDKAGERAQLLIALAKFAGRLVGLYWGRDRIPGLGRERRWFMGQPYMVPRHSQDFLGFAARLTRDRRDFENPEQVRKLLVHAFLEDLRIAYRRTRLRFLPRRRGLRRTAHVTALLDNVDGPGGWELLRLVNEVRNETGQLDPLLIITTSRGQPALLGEPPGPNKPNVAKLALTAWKGRLPRRRQLLAEDARYLFVTLPATVPPDDAGPDEQDRRAWETEAREQPRPEPRLARRGVAEVVAVCALLAALVVPTLAVRDHWRAGCAFFGAVSGGVATGLARIDGHDQCVGYSDSDRQVFGDNPRLRLAQEHVFAQNEVAERLHREVRDRPYVSLVYFAGLTANDSAPATEHSVAEELEGLVIRQREQNTTTSTAEPLLRVVVANGGAGMDAAAVVARDMIVPLTRSDPSILGVVGLDRSVAQTEEAIRELGRHGVPTLGTTLTKVGLDRLSPLYFQLVPDNGRQAALLGEYARRVRATAVTIYHPPVDGPNTYVTSLVEAVRDRLGGGGVAVSTTGWVGSPTELPALCADQRDRSGEVVFYAGRENDFGDFLRTVRRNCPDLARLPRIVADDATSRFVAHAPGRDQNEFNGVSVSYVGMGGLVVLAGRRCVEGGSGALAGGASALDAFCAGYRDLREDLGSLPAEDRPVMPWPGERVGGLYDTAGLFVDAVRRLRSADPAPPHPAAIAQEFREMTFLGATGVIDFRASRIANGRNLAVLTIDNVRDLEGDDGVPRCVLMVGALYREDQPRQDNGCPGAP
ncbi:ABC transporter substrate-binding protein [Saccharothrix syringae]|uniref:ABC transporter substrate-binding protein n=1 Tax=Saccharothrix syringae TaxID=103733 RepID=UPI000B09F3F8|nr:ABC transporter substrate-binding protein [Saccharothrix syringae]